MIIQISRIIRMKTGARIGIMAKIINIKNPVTNNAQLSRSNHIRKTKIINEIILSLHKMLIYFIITDQSTDFNYCFLHKSNLMDKYIYEKDVQL